MSSGSVPSTAICMPLTMNLSWMVSVMFSRDSMPSRRAISAYLTRSAISFCARLGLGEEGVLGHLDEVSDFLQREADEQRREACRRRRWSADGTSMNVVSGSSALTMDQSRSATPAINPIIVARSMTSHSATPASLSGRRKGPQCPAVLDYAPDDLVHALP